MPDCVLCSVDPKAVIGRNGDAAVVLHDDWAVDLHLMIVAARHVENFSDLSEEESIGFASLWRAAERAALDVTGCERSILMKLGIAVPHLHLHIYPFANDADRAAVMNAIDGNASSSRTEVERAALVGALRKKLG